MKNLNFVMSTCLFTYQLCIIEMLFKIGLYTEIRDIHEIDLSGFIEFS